MRRTTLQMWAYLMAAVVLLIAPVPLMAQPDDGDPVTYRTYAVRGTERAAINKPPEQVEQEARAFRASVAACDSGDTAACVALGKAYEFGMGTPQVRPVAAILYDEACELGNAEGCYRLGVLDSVAKYGLGGANAALSYERACDLGSAKGCLALADMLSEGDAISRDIVRAEALFRSVCDAGEVAACHELATLLVIPDRGPAANAEAVELLEGLCGAGDFASCNRLFYLSSNEDFPAPIPPKAQLLRLACSAGDAYRCRDFGNAAFRGDGMMQDSVNAFEAYDRACALEPNLCRIGDAMRSVPGLSQRCQAGDMAGCAALGTILRDAETGYYDPEGGADLLARACRGGEASACGEAGLAALALHPAPETSRAADAREFLEMSCEADVADSCSTLANALFYGGALGQDRTRAFELYGVLCDNGKASSCETLEDYLLEQPGIPLPLAGANFVPPDDPETGESPAAERLAEFYPKDDYEACTTSTVMFRGREYTDTVCDPTVRVINSLALDPGQAPWQALIWRPEFLRGVGTLLPQGRVKCGGAALRRGWILTAAHCLTDYERSIVGRGYTVRLGVHNPRNDEGVAYPTIAAYVHPTYDRRDFAFDIALIRYDANRGISAPTTNKIAYILPDQQPFERRTITKGMPVYVYGWGWTRANNGESTAELRGARLELSSPEECTEISGYKEPGPRDRNQVSKLNSALCAAGRNLASSCKGDSGGPLIYYGDADRKPRVVGVVSTGEDCGQTGIPGLYTRVGTVYPWIAEIMRTRP